MFGDRRALASGEIPPSLSLQVAFRREGGRLFGPRKQTHIGLDGRERGCSQTATLVYKSVSIHRPNLSFSPSRCTLFNSSPSDVQSSSKTPKTYLSETFSFKSNPTVTMQFTLSAVLGLAATVAALPPVAPAAGGVGNANGVANKGNTNVRFPVPESMTVKQAQAKCGDQAQLSCCNKATYAGDTTDVNSGMLGGALSNLIGAGSGAAGLGLFDQCSKLDLQSMFDNYPLVNNMMLTIASPRYWCPHPGPGQPEVQAEHCLLPELSFQRGKSLHIYFRPTGSNDHRTPTSSALPCPALLSAPSSKCSSMFLGIV